MDAHLIRGLLLRVEAASGPDREIDYAIEEWAHPWLGARGYVRCPGDNGWQRHVPLSDGEDRIRAADDYTASVDAALGLVERKLPGWSYMLDTRPVNSIQFPEWTGRVRVRLYAPGLFAATFDPPVVAGSHAQAFGATAPLAILAALLKALISGAEHG